jgi:transcription elongation regulator 1
VKKERDLANPEEAFERFLKEEIKSTRTSWTDFRRTWKKDRRFWGWGRDDRQREKRFREYLKELGESESSFSIAKIRLTVSQKSELRLNKLKSISSRC